MAEFVFQETDTVVVLNFTIISTLGRNFPRSLEISF